MSVCHLQNIKRLILPTCNSYAQPPPCGKISRKYSDSCPINLEQYDHKDVHTDINEERKSHSILKMLVYFFFLIGKFSANYCK